MHSAGDHVSGGHPPVTPTSGVCFVAAQTSSTLTAVSSTFMVSRAVLPDALHVLTAACSVPYRKQKQHHPGGTRCYSIQPRLLLARAMATGRQCCTPENEAGAFLPLFMFFFIIETGECTAALWRAHTHTHIAPPECADMLATGRRMQWHYGL